MLWLQVPYERLLYRIYKLLGIKHDPGKYHLTLWNVALLRQALSRRFIVEAVFHDVTAVRMRHVRSTRRAKLFASVTSAIGYAPAITALARVK